MDRDNIRHVKFEVRELTQ